MKPEEVRRRRRVEPQRTRGMAAELLITGMEAHTHYAHDPLNH